MKKIFGMALKLAIAGGIVAILVWKTPPGMTRVFQNLHPGWLAAAAFFYGTHIFANAWRWHILLKAQKIDCSLWEACSLTMQSFFFSLVIPGGAIGGDLVRIGFLTAKVPKEQKFDGAFTIMMDRFTGMIGIFSLALLMLPFCWKYLSSSSAIMDTMVYGLLAGSAAGLCGAAAVFQHRQLEKIPLFLTCRNLADRYTGSLFSKMADALDRYKHCKKELAVCILASIVFVNVNLGVVAFCVSRGLDPLWKSFGASLAAITTGNIAGLLPLTPSGIGARDVFVKSILETGGMTRQGALAAALTVTALILLFNLAGGLFFITSSHGKK